MASRWYCLLQYLYMSICAIWFFRNIQYLFIVWLYQSSYFMFTSLLAYIVYWGMSPLYVKPKMFAGPFKISLTQLFLRFKGKLDCLYNNIFLFQYTWRNISAIGNVQNTVQERKLDYTNNSYKFICLEALLACTFSHYFRYQKPILKNVMAQNKNKRM